MHSPETVAFEIRSPFKKKMFLFPNGYREPIITIWHNDPCKDGTDDSCGWFMRDRHIDKNIIEKVRKEFGFNFKHNYWFNDGGYPKLSTMGIVLEMYSKAAWVIFTYQNKDRIDRRRHRKFMKKHLYDILHFAENATDSLYESINMKYGVESQEVRVRDFSDIITADIFRKERKWYQHPKWHIHHWQIKFNTIQNLKNRYWTKCCECGKRGTKGSWISNWEGTKRWHWECDKITKVQNPISESHIN